MRIPNELRPSQIFKQDSLSPSKIALQIVLLQIFYYATASVLFYIWATMLGHPIEMTEWLFSYKYIDFSNAYGLSLCLLWLVDSLICVVFLTVIVGRSKLAWDFALTIHAINFIVVCLWTKTFPSLAWFLLQLLSALILSFLGTWTSRWRELKDTFFEGMIENSQGANQRGSSDDHGGMLEDGLRDPMEMNDLEVQK